MRLKFVFALIALVIGGLVSCADEGRTQEDEAAAPMTSGVNHIGLTVKDLEASI